MKIISWRSCLIIFGLMFWLPSASCQNAGANHIITQLTPRIITIHVGDTVTWSPDWLPAIIDSLDGEWESPILTNSEATFSRTFDRTGDFIYRYRALYDIGSPGFLLAWTSHGMVRVLPRSEPAPAVEITSPLEGFIFTDPAIFTIQASVTNQPTEIASVEFFVGNDLEGTSTNAPYRAVARGVKAGKPQVRAKLTDIEGRVVYSKPVTIVVLPSNHGLLSGLKRLPTGQFQFFYAAPTIGNWKLQSSEDMEKWTTIGYFRFGSRRAGLWVDDTAACVRQRFYRFKYEGE